MTQFLQLLLFFPLFNPNPYFRNFFPRCCCVFPSCFIARNTCIVLLSSCSLPIYSPSSQFLSPLGPYTRFSVSYLIIDVVFILDLLICVTDYSMWFYWSCVADMAYDQDQRCAQVINSTYWLTPQLKFRHLCYVIGVRLIRFTLVYFYTYDPLSLQHDLFLLILVILFCHKFHALLSILLTLFMSAFSN